MSYYPFFIDRLLYRN